MFFVTQNLAGVRQYENEETKGVLSTVDVRVDTNDGRVDDNQLYRIQSIYHTIIPIHPYDLNYLPTYLRTYVLIRGICEVSDNNGGCMIVATYNGQINIISCVPNRM